MVWIDRQLGRVTMYRIVLIVLIVIALSSLVLSAVGVLFYPLPALVVSIVVAVGVSWVSNRLIAVLFRLTPHSESSIITGLLLFFILSPSIEPLGVGIIAVSALVASMSKYGLAVRGRHIVNPAAFAAFFVGAVSVALSGNAVSLWWIATGPLLPLVVVGGLLVVLRTRRFASPALFVVVAAGIVAGQLLIGGQPLSAALTTPFLSYPIVFFALFMFTEPLTLPPRRWQQLLEAVVVGLLFALPYNIGPIFATPEFALVVGNLLAFVFMQRRGIALTFESRRALTPTITEMTWKTSAPVKFAAGQYLEVSAPHRRSDSRGQRRVFSIVSAPSDSDRVTIAYRSVAPLSSFKAALATLQPGDSIRATGVWGDFTLPKNAEHPLILIAAGIGVTPFISQLAELSTGPDLRDIVLVYGVSDNAETAYIDDLARSGIRVLIAAPERPDTLPEHWEYLGPGRISHDRLIAAVPDLAERAAYISGPPGLIANLRPALQRVTRVHTDAFSGY